MSKRETRRWAAREERLSAWGARLASAASVLVCRYTSRSLARLKCAVRSSSTTSRLPAGFSFHLSSVSLACAMSSTTSRLPAGYFISTHLHSCFPGGAIVLHDMQKRIAKRSPAHALNMKCASAAFYKQPALDHLSTAEAELCEYAHQVSIPGILLASWAMADAPRWFTPRALSPPCAVGSTTRGKKRGRTQGGAV